jgi:flagellar biosynthesis/type III secretory pathway protein FliH
MATLIRSARIADQRRMLGNGTASDDGVNAEVELPIGRQPNNSEEVGEWDLEQYKTSQEIDQLKEELRISQARASQTEAELQQLLGDIETLRQDAMSTGREVGYQTGQAEGHADSSRHIDQLAEITDQLLKAKADTIAAAEEEMVEVVFASVVKILGDAFLHTDAVVAVVRQSIKQLVNRDRLVIHLSPGDKRLLDDLARDREEALFGDKVEILADERIELGGCLLQTQSGGLDARLEVQIQQLRDCLLDVAGRRREEDPS